MSSEIMCVCVCVCVYVCVCSRLCFWTPQWCVIKNVCWKIAWMWVSQSLCATPSFLQYVIVCMSFYSAGNICMFASNEAVKVSVDETPVQLNKTLDNIKTFLTAVPQVRETLWWMGVHRMEVNRVGPRWVGSFQYWLTYYSFTLKHLRPGLWISRWVCVSGIGHIISPQQPIINLLRIDKLLCEMQTELQFPPVGPVIN